MDTRIIEAGVRAYHRGEGILVWEPYLIWEWGERIGLGTTSTTPHDFGQSWYRSWESAANSLVEALGDGKTVTINGEECRVVQHMMLRDDG